MKKLDRFILKGFVGPFIAILAIVIFILVMQFLWLYIDELVGKGLGLKVVAEFLMWGSFTVLPLALPLATLLASMMTMGQLSENFELIAMKSAGVSISRIMLPIATASLLISIGAFFIGNSLVPYSYNAIFTLRDDIGRTKEEIKIPPGVFYDGIDGYILRVDEALESGMMKGIMVYDHGSNKGNTTVTLADSAMMRMSKSKDFLTFTLYNGTNYHETNSLSYRDTSMKLERVRFDKQELIIPLANYSFQKSEDNRFGDQTKSMTLTQLHDNKDTLTTQFNERHEAQVRDLLRNFNLVKGAQFDTVWLNKGLQPFAAEDFLEWDSDYVKVDAYNEAINKCKQYQMDLTTFSQDQYETTFYLRRTDLDILKKFTTALACLLLFLIGAPLGALIRKGGLGATAIIAVLFFLLYWVIDITGEKLAKDGAISAFNGRFAVFYILLPIGIYMTWKAMHDSSINNLDGIKAWWRKAKSRIKNMFKKTRIVYMGTPDFAVGPLDTLIKAGHNIVGVVTVADKPSGRGLQVNESAVKKYAVEHSIPVLQPLKLKDPEFLQQLAEWKADMFVVVAFRMLPEEVWKMPRLGTFNLHAALLPQYRGAAPINWAVINGEAMTGVTTFMIDQDIDTGGIILRKEYRIKDTDTAGDVHDALMEIGSGLVLDTVDGIIEKNVETRVQRSFIQGSEVLKPAPKLTKETCRIDWTRSTKDIYNLVRGLSPYPTAWTEISAKGDEEAKKLSLKIFFGEKMELETAAAPGTVISDGKSFFAIATGDGALKITDLQLAGKKRMDVKAFLLGFRDPESYIAA